MDKFNSQLYRAEDKYQIQILDIRGQYADRFKERQNIKKCKKTWKRHMGRG